ncbi:DUF7447 family protein [Catenulispora rubra]|uniref:DUF7447 family protein n=1 Tax=Catenulispora rubra TaxID=280293 RepID=UPI001892048D|nr:hypothetical protein [Catenulispora rubra]
MTTLTTETRIHHMNSIDRIMQEAENHGHHFFSPSNMVAFRSIVDDEVFVGEDGAYFVTSEQMSGDFWAGGMGSIAKAFGSTDADLRREHPRLYSVKRATLTDDSFEIDNAGKGRQISEDRADAIEYARHLAYDKHACAVCGGKLVPNDYIPTGYPDAEFLHVGQSWTDLDDADHMPVRAETGREG